MSDRSESDGYTTGAAVRTLYFALAAVLAATPWAFAVGESPAVDYPIDFRSWQHVKSMVIRPDHPLADRFGGVHHIYANAEALSGLAAGQYQSGAVFVFDLLDYDETDQAITEAGRRRLDVMQYDRGRSGATGGWGFASFVADSRELFDQDVVEECFACHTSAEASNYVFSTYRP